MKTIEEFMPTIYDYEKKGEELLKLRPKPIFSVASRLKDFFFDRALFLKSARLTVWETMKFLPLDPKKQFELNLWSCISDEERFWFAMCILKYERYHNIANPTGSINFEKVYIDVVSENAAKFDSLEAYRLLSTNSGRNDTVQIKTMCVAPKNYRIGRIEDSLLRLGLEPDSLPAETVSQQTVSSEDYATLRATLRYVDHLLELLPVERIENFAKSESFRSYIKVFEILCLDDPQGSDTPVMREEVASFALRRDEAVLLAETLANLNVLMRELPGEVLKAFESSSHGQAWQRLIKEFS